MKHTPLITIYLVLLFLAAQFVGLLVTNKHIDHTIVEDGIEYHVESVGQLAFGTERPQTQSIWGVVGLISLAIFAGTVLMLILIRFRQRMILKGWFYAAIALCVTYSLGSFINEGIAFIIGLLIAYFKIIRPNIIVHNIGEVLLYGAIGALFVPMDFMNITAAVIILGIISIYDMFAVWQSKHMIKLAKFQTDAKAFAGLMLPYKNERSKKTKTKSTVKGKKVTKKVEHAILGGGDIAFPLMFAGAVMKTLMLGHTQIVGFLLTFIIIITAAISLLILLIKAEKGKFYPAMPFLSAGCMVGYLIVWFLVVILGI